MLGLGKNLTELKSRIHKAQKELEQIGVPQQPLPEVIEMTNLLRTNEYLARADEKKSELILAYDTYTKQLEQLVSSLLSIQADLKDIVKTQASLIGSKRKNHKKDTKPKSGKSQKNEKRLKKTKQQRR